MTQASIYQILSDKLTVQAQSITPFLSSKHQDYLAAIAEPSSAKRVFHPA